MDWMTETLLPDQMYEALLNKDSRFDGIFFVAVKTTGIFCRPICTARKPKRENVVFYATDQEALLNGFRPCKICQPCQKKEEIPQYISELLEEIHQDTTLKITDWQLKQRGIDPYHLRRWFKKHFQVSFQAYQRTIKMTKALKKIEKGKSVSATAYDSGYESLSGFTHSFKKTIGFTPQQSTQKMLITLKKITTPLGLMLAGTTEKGICILEFTDRKMLETELQQLEKNWKATFVYAYHDYLTQIEQELNEYFAKERQTFETPLDMEGTDFQRVVWQKLLEIPYGQTRSYEAQALQVGNPLAIRAVAQANGANKMAIVIPCHRVIGKDGKLTGYGGGIWRKKWLLEHEGSIQNNGLF